MTIDPIQLEVFKHRFAAVAEEMGAVLRKASYSPNIKERRDFSCAIFNSQGQLIAQAEHIPVHLGSMPASVQAALQEFPDMAPGDIVVLNDPFRGGTHLPDITMVSPVYVPSKGETQQNLFGFVASRAHHADVGGMTPGSMPVAREIYQEGLIIPPIKLVQAGQPNPTAFSLILANVRTPKERRGDLWAQIAAHKRGEHRLSEMATEFGMQTVNSYMQALLDYTETMTRRLLLSIPDGEYAFVDYLDDDGVSDKPVPIAVKITIQGDSATVDFSDSAPQQQGSINAVYAITLSAVYYLFRCLLRLDIPNNDGCLAPIQVIAPEGTVVNARHPAAVAGGNVETSQRIVDVLLGAMAQATPGRIPAASQGTMNNITIGGAWASDPSPQDDPGESSQQEVFAYYETIGGGAGALPDRDGPSAIHSHMTNTLNTPVEALEYAYPLRVIRYKIRDGSGGEGRFRGGDGICRDVQLLTNAQVTLLTERRQRGPYGLEGGSPGKPGLNLVYRGDQVIHLPSKGTVELQAGDVLSIATPGGGGFGAQPKDETG